VIEAFDEGEEKLRECGKRLGLSGQQVAKWKYQVTEREHEISDEELNGKVIDIALSFDANNVIDCSFYKGGFAIMVTTRTFLNTKIALNDVVCFAGNVNFIKKKKKTKKNRTLVMCGVIKNGEVDPSHSYELMALGILSSEEKKVDCSSFIHLVSLNRDDDALDCHSKSMLDGGGGFRAALDERIELAIQLIRPRTERSPIASICISLVNEHYGATS
jgi:hypothetical protein